jgi:hypothetical protein
VTIVHSAGLANPSKTAILPQFQPFRPSFIMSSNLSVTFPAIQESDLRERRWKSFGVATVVALLPAIVAVVWHGLDGLNQVDLYKEIPDFAFSGFAVAVAGAANTVWSSVKADGFRTGGFTSSFAVALGFSAFFSFIIYIKASFAPPASNNLSTLFCAMIIMTISTLFFAVVLHLCFLSDECRGVRRQR